MGFAQVGFALVGCRTTRLTAGPAAPDTCATVHVQCVCVCLTVCVCSEVCMVPVSGWQHSGVHRVAYPRTGYAIVGKRLAVCNRSLTSCETSTIRFVLLLPRVCDSKGSATRLTLRDLHRDSAHPATSAPGLGSPLPHPHRDCWAGFRGISLTEAIQWTVRALHRTARAIPSRCAPSPGASVAGVPQCRCGRGEPIPVQQRCGSGALVQSVSARGPSRWQSYTRFSRF